MKLQRIENGESVTSADAISSGEAQLFTMALDILTAAAVWEIEDQTELRLMLIDEPDAHIHPDLQVRLADFLIQVAKRFDLQVVVATHSTTLLAAIGHFAGDDGAVVFLSRNQASYTAAALTAITRELTACLGGHALMGPLFGAPILLVEGDDDYRIWSQVPRHHVVNLAVIPCRGSEIRVYQQSLEAIFEALREDSSSPVGFALLDGDQEIPNVSQRHIKFVKLACLESENLFLTDEVLHYVGHTWPSALVEIQSSAARYARQRATLEAAPRWDRKTSDIKKVIRRLESILDPTETPWTSRVGTTIGHAVPSGQLREFLGDDVLQALWAQVP